MSFQIFYDFQLEHIIIEIQIDCGKLEVSSRETQIEIKIIYTVLCLFKMHWNKNSFALNQRFIKQSSLI